MEETINLRVRTKLWTKIMRLPSFYYDEDSGDQLVSRVTSDAEAPSSLFSMAVSFVVCIVTSIQAFVQLYSYNTVLANYSLIIIPLTLIVCVIYGKLIFRLGVFGTVTTASSLFSIMFIVIIFVMKDGSVEAAGTTDELLKTNEYYKMFVKTL